MDLVHPELAQARSNWRRLAAQPALRMRLALDIAQTRAAELTLAYKNLVAVTAGFKQRTTTTGQQRLQCSACVVFVVKRKWPKQATRPATAGLPLGHAARQHLPAELLTHAQLDGQRVLVAVPTDVQPAARLQGGRAASDSGVKAAASSGAAVLGTLACPVALQPASPLHRHLVLSAMHVLSPMAVPGTDPPPSGAVLHKVSGASGPGTQLGQALGMGGRLIGNAAWHSFDCQLATVPDTAWLRSAMADLDLSVSRPQVPDFTSFHEHIARGKLRILVASNLPKRPDPRPLVTARFHEHANATMAVRYEVEAASGTPTEIDVFHEDLLILQMIGTHWASPGDSGAAVIGYWPDDGSETLVGLFIASDATNGLAYVIPTWELFNLNRWSGLPVGTKAIKLRSA